ncbi:MAG: hypothetical protein C1O27_001006 [Chloroflexi bacterium]|jgi:hypothetical protein|nr:MAG: hypothetical protein C1O27_001006 [Chloroflexota bacterium]
MAKGHSNCIGGIIWLRDFLQPELEADHFLDLALTAAAIAGNRLLYSRGRIGANEQVRGSGNDEAYSLRLPYCYASSAVLVLRNEWLLKSHLIWGQAVNEDHQVLMETVETHGQRKGSGLRQNAVLFNGNGLIQEERVPHPHRSGINP